MSDKLNLLENSSNQPWYSKGLNFECTGCGGCCTGGPGYTWISEEEILAMADYLKISLDDFGRKYLRQVGGRYALLEKPASYDCILLDGKRCTVYPVRPTQCQTFPFWPGTIQSEQAWRDTAVHCEGIRDDAPIVSFEEIERQRERQIESEL
ncbi:MAG: YkgJ family cysteine cluster protein [Chlamydiales bacterium]|nr:YkgJ family cysteine cluster protein [Chlamydiales bacterium]